MSMPPINFILKPKLNWHLVSLISASSLITVSLTICNTVQSKVSRNLADLGASLTNIDVNEGYATHSKLKANSPLCKVGENNLQHLQTINDNQNKGH